jgi:hypothetical protein
MIRKYFDAAPGESSGGGITVGATRSVADFINQASNETETQTQTETKVENNSVENTGATVPQETSSNEPGAPEKKDASEAPVNTN